VGSVSDEQPGAGGRCEWDAGLELGVVRDAVAVVCAGPGMVEHVLALRVAGEEKREVS
jgi:hypothetical protein